MTLIRFLAELLAFVVLIAVLLTICIMIGL